MPANNNVSIKRNSTVQRNLEKQQQTPDYRLKRSQDWTKAELQAAMKARENASSADEKAQMMALEKRWFDHFYGTDPVRFDETGKMIQPEPVRPIPEIEKPVTLPGGETLEDALDQVYRILPYPSAGNCLIDPSKPFDAKKDGNMRLFENDLNKGIQTGLNMLSGMQNAQSAPGQGKARKLKEDGVMGPKTAFGLKKALVEHGRPKVSEAIALGQFGQTVKKAKQTGAQNLAQDLSATFSPLLAAKKTPRDGFQPEGLALQDTLNDLGADLKDDGIIGPKTVAVFNQIAKSKDTDDIVNRFGENIGFMS